MKEKKRKKLKGMTLMECIISIFVLAALAMIVVVAGVSAVTNMRTAKRVSDKNASQSAYASAKFGAEKSGEMRIDMSGAGTGRINVDAYEVKVDESPDDQVGNYRYFEIPVPSALPTGP